MAAHHAPHSFNWSVFENVHEKELRERMIMLGSLASHVKGGGASCLALTLTSWDINRNVLRSNRPPPRAPQGDSHEGSPQCAQDEGRLRPKLRLFTAIVK